MEQNNGTVVLQCVYCSSSSRPRTPVLVLAIMCQCGLSRSHYRTAYAAEIDAMCVWHSVRARCVRGVLLL
jgi:hypothetical protein